MAQLSFALGGNVTLTADESRFYDGGATITANLYSAADRVTQATPLWTGTFAWSVTLAEYTANVPYTAFNTQPASTPGDTTTMGILVTVGTETVDAIANRAQLSDDVLFYVKG